MLLPEEADVVTKSDPADDAPAHLDIRKVTYQNRPKVVGFTFRVPDLERRGRAMAVVGQPNSDVGYVARLRIDEDGELVKRFFYSTVASMHPAKCDFTARWSAARGTIRVVVPQSCLKEINDSKRYYMSGRTGGANGDWAAPARHLERG